jgi:DNA-binding NarL/FixJ family response regulator
MTKLRVLIADDHQMIRDGLLRLINSEPDMEVVGEAGDGQSALLRVRELGPDVVVMDISMPGMSAARATELIRRESPGVRVIVLTGYVEKGYIRQMLRAGASGYVLKLAASEELIKAIRMVAAGETYLDSVVTGKVVDSYARQKPREISARRETLTRREEEILRLVAQGYVNKEIAAQLDISVKTVETHKSNFMEKLGLHSRAEVVRYAMSRGWLQNE